MVGGTVGSVLTTPYSAAVVTLLYFDLRVRKEGLDLQLIAEGAGVERDPDAPLPAPLAADEYTPEERAQAPLLAAAARLAPGAGAGAGAEPAACRARRPSRRAWRPAPDEPSPSGWLPPRAGEPARGERGAAGRRRSDRSRSSGG